MLRTLLLLVSSPMTRLPDSPLAQILAERPGTIIFVSTDDYQLGLDFPIPGKDFLSPFETPLECLGLERMVHLDRQKHFRHEDILFLPPRVFLTKKLKSNKSEQRRLLKSSGSDVRSFPQHGNRRTGQRQHRRW